ncbi:energy-coupling factor transporter transmembrane component T [Desulfosporosinus sp. PR]|uniref:energy-coupling factor transporter transmembrane component T family protein n=1 Tax=Candidatus Desulfosporosinus nitrosoreducens TaxID=3401928 RepID=UPI0027F81D15|nr:energy-coupling factor transporter transmembrane component T [Desulfosporosinus sp. PR]MDQ7093460.1 energy-coupling factor transporter transmembrane component T [Desulfosporosinus sp. PR]
MFVGYAPGDTIIHRLDVRTKVLGFVGMIAVSFMFQDPVYQLAIVAAAGFLALWTGIPLGRIGRMIIPLLPIVVSIILLTGFTFAPQRFEQVSSQKILFYLFPGKRLGASVGGFLLGTTFLLRLWSMLMASSVLTSTTSLEDFTQFFLKMKVPAEISMMITTALRFIPILDKKRRLILEAQKARGTKFNGQGITGSIRSYLPIMIPLFINSILMANSLSMAMLNRGYGRTRAWTPNCQKSLALRDFRAMFLIVLAMMGAIFARFKLHLGVL